MYMVLLRKEDQVQGLRKTGRRGCRKKAKPNIGLKKGRKTKNTVLGRKEDKKMRLRKKGRENIGFREEGEVKQEVLGRINANQIFRKKGKPNRRSINAVKEDSVK